MTGRVQPQTSYLSFVLHEQDLWVKFCSTQKCVNRNKMDKTAYIIWYEEQFITAPHAKTTPHDEQFCHLRLLVLWSNFVSHDHQIAPHEKFCSTDKVRRVRDKYDVCPDFDGQSGKGGCCKMATKEVTSQMLSLNLSHFVGWPLSMGKHSLRPD